MPGGFGKFQQVTNIKRVNYKCFSATAGLTSGLIIQFFLRNKGNVAEKVIITIIKCIF